MTKFLYGTNVFLTGGSSGIGLAVSESLATCGYTVFAASRHPSADTRTFPGGGEIRPVTIDVRDESSVETAVTSVLSEADIGIVVHCAGMGIACPAEDFPSQAVAGLMDTNYYGVLRVNSRILPHMRERGSGLCLIIGSVAGTLSVPYQSHYCSSKSALDSYATALRMELRSFGLRVCIVLPGDTSTGFTSARTYEIDETSPFYAACLEAVKKMERDEIGGKPPGSVARVILRLCRMKSPPARKIVGFDYKALILLSRVLPYRFVEFILRKIYLSR